MSKSLAVSIVLVAFVIGCSQATDKMTSPAVTEAAVGAAGSGTFYVYQSDEQWYVDFCNWSVGGILINGTAQIIDGELVPLEPMDQPAGTWWGCIAHWVRICIELHPEGGEDYADCVAAAIIGCTIGYGILWAGTSWHAD